MVSTEWIKPLELFIRSVSSRTRHKGTDYAKHKKVHKIGLWPDGVVRALVKGSSAHVYESTLRLVRVTGKRLAIDAECSCPVGYDCKHTVAAALLLLDLAERTVQGDVDFDDLDLAEPAPPAPVKGRASPKPQAPERRVAQPWWVDFVAAASKADRVQALHKGVSAHLSGHIPIWTVDYAYGALCSDEAPLDTLFRFEDFLQHIVKSIGGRSKALDPSLVAYLGAPERVEQLEQQRQVANEATLLKWLENETSQARENAQIQVELTVIPRQGGIPQLAFTLFLTTDRLQRSPRQTQSILHLHREMTSGSKFLTPWESAFLRWLVNRDELVPQYSGYKADTADVQPFPMHDPVSWLALWSNAPFVSWDDGSRVVLAPESAYLDIAMSSDGHPEWHVMVRMADGQHRSQPLREANLVSETSGSNRQTSDPVQLFARFGSALHLVHTRDMPPHVLDAIYNMNAAPVQRLRESGAGQRLVSRLGDGTARKPELVAELPVRVAVECWFDGSDLRVCAKATADDNTTFCFCGNGTWRRPDARLRALRTDESFEALLAEDGEDSDAVETNQPGALDVGHALSVLPRRADVEPVEVWIDAVLQKRGKITLSSDGFPALERRITTKEGGAVAQLWTERPRGAEYFGNPAFRSLVTVAHIPRFHIRAEPSGTDWLQVSVEMEGEIAQLGWNDVDAALAATDASIVALPGGRRYRRGDLEAYKAQLESLVALGIDTGEVQRIHAMQLGAIGADALEKLGIHDDRFRSLANVMKNTIARFKGIPKAKIAKDTGAHLREYQRAGADFLVWAATTFGGALLADDMGLGKTLQVLAAVTALQKLEKKRRPSLVVCPASVMHNWQREATRFAPTLRTLVIERGKARHDLYDSFDQYDLIIKNYTLTRMDAERLRAREFMVVCVDEAQAIKNPDADIARTVKSLNATYRFALTGTPIENRITDLWSILDFAVPAYLPHRKQLETRIKSGDVQPLVRMLRARLRPVLLRRVKAEVAPELPPRIEERRDCTMTTAQRQAYLAEVKKTRLMLDGMKNVVGPGRIVMLAALTRLRQLCCDPSLLGLAGKGSGKVDELFELIPPLLEAGHKVLIFSQFVRMIERIEKALVPLNIPTFKLTGATTKRQQLVDRFEQHPDPCVFLISLKAGGTGLNLVSASHVVLFDPWWNPAVEAQAIDRAHRIGQDKTVVAFRLVTLGTIEERIIELQQRKSALVKNVLEEDAFNRTLTRDDFTFLLGEEK